MFKEVVSQLIEAGAVAITVKEAALLIKQSRGKQRINSFMEAAFEAGLCISQADAAKSLPDAISQAIKRR